MKTPTKYLKTLTIALGLAGAFFPGRVYGIDVASTAKALKLSGEITGGYMPTSDPLFAQMVTQIAAGNVKGAAATAANSKYFAQYLARRLAFEMQNTAMSATGGTDNDSTTFIIAHFAGTSTVKPSISTLWSDNSTYLVAPTAGAAPVSTSTLTAAQIHALDWTTAISQVAGQTARQYTVVKNVPQAIASTTPIPAMHVGGYMTLSSKGGDNSFAQAGLSAGTNLRMIEGMWETATGQTLLNLASTEAPAENAPRFVPEFDPNFFVGQGQNACIACHGGGMSNITHGYATVADVFDYDATLGIAYISTLSTNAITRKSLGSDSTKRVVNSTCNLATNPTAVCNPDSLGVDPNQAWNLNDNWASLGILSNVLGWKGPTSGNGLNSLGAALGQADIVYQFLAQRVIKEVCPGGSFYQSDINAIANAANPFATPAGTDDVRTMVALVASNPMCL